MRLSGLVFVLALSCSGDSFQGGSSITYSEASSAVVGETGRLRLSVAAPVADDTDVTLTSNVPGVAQVPAKATIKKGGLHVEVSYMGLAAGTATLTARLGDSTRNMLVRVYPSMELTSFSSPGTMQTGAASSFSVSINLVTPKDVPVTLTSSNPAVMEVPSEVVIPAFTSSVAVAVQAKGAGTAVITASAGGNTIAGSVFVVDELVFTSFSANNPRLQVGAVTSAFPSLNAVPAADVTFHLTSSDPAVATVPAQLVVPAGSSSGSVTVTAVSPGAATISVEMGGVTRSFAFVVVADPMLNTFNLNTGARAVVGAPTTLTVGVDALLANATEVTLSSSDAAVLAVPATAKIPAGATQLVVPVSVLAAGPVKLQATLGAITRTVFITAVATQTLTSISFTGRLVVGAASDLSVFTDVSSASEAVVNLTSSKPDVIAVPSTLIINPGSTSAGIQLVALKAGTTVLTAELGGVTKSVTVGVLTDVSITSASANTRALVGATLDLSVSLDATPIVEKTVTLTSSNPAVLSVPSSMALSSSFGTATMQAKAVGSSLVTATMGSSSRSTVVYVVNAPSLNNVGVSTPVQVGATGSFFVNFDTTLVAEQTVTLSSSNPAVMQVPGSIVVAPQFSSASLPVRGLTSGATVITATANGVSRSTVATVVATASLQSFGISPGADRIQVGAPAGLFFSTQAILANDGVVTISNSNPSVIGAPTSVTIFANSSSAFVGVTPLAPGSAILNATFGGVTRTVGFTVVDIPTLTYALGTSISVGNSLNFIVSTDVVVAADTAVSILNDNPAALPTPPQLVIPAGTSSLTTRVTAAAAGSSTVSVFLTAHPSPSPAPTTVTVTP